VRIQGAVLDHPGGREVVEELELMKAGEALRVILDLAEAS
jgi:hypothetical protein